MCSVLWLVTSCDITAFLSSYRRVERQWKGLNKVKVSNESGQFYLVLFIAWSDLAKVGNHHLWWTSGAGITIRICTVWNYSAFSVFKYSLFCIDFWHNILSRYIYPPTYQCYRNFIEGWFKIHIFFILISLFWPFRFTTFSESWMCQLSFANQRLKQRKLLNSFLNICMRALARHCY